MTLDEFKAVVIRHYHEDARREFLTGGELNLLRPVLYYVQVLTHDGGRHWENAYCYDPRFSHPMLNGEVVRVGLVDDESEETATRGERPPGDGWRRHEQFTDEDDETWVAWRRPWHD